MWSLRRQRLTFNMRAQARRKIFNFCYMWHEVCKEVLSYFVACMHLKYLVWTTPEVDLFKPHYRACHISYQVTFHRNKIYRVK